MAEEGNIIAHYHLGSTTLLTDSTGNVVQAISYLPYGEELPECNRVFAE